MEDDGNVELVATTYTERWLGKPDDESAISSLCSALWKFSHAQNADLRKQLAEAYKGMDHHKDEWMEEKERSLALLAAKDGEIERLGVELKLSGPVYSRRKLESLLAARDGELLALRETLKYLIQNSEIKNLRLEMNATRSGRFLSMWREINRSTTDSARKAEARIEKGIWAKVVKITEEGTGAHCCEDCPCGIWNEEIQAEAKK